MFRSRRVKIGLVIFIISLFSAVWAYTHSGRTDRYGGHHDRKNGGYHYHNSGTVRRSTPAPSRITRPKLSVPISEGSKPYTPTRVEWLSLDLNAGIPTTSIRYYTTEKSDTIQVCVFHEPTMTLKQRQQLMNFGKEMIRNEANRRSWNWLKLEEYYQEIK